MITTIVLDPLIPVPVLIVLAVLAVGFIALAILHGLSGWALRAGAAIVLFLALVSPQLQQEDREALTDIVIAVVDKSTSQALADRAQQTDSALATLQERIATLENTELRRVDVVDGVNDTGTLAMTALTKVLAEEPQSRIAGVFLITDGRIHDIEAAPNLPAPVHLMLTGRPDDWDRRLVVHDAPAYAIVEESTTLTLRVEDQGQTPAGETTTQLEISVDGDEPMRFDVPIGQNIELPLTLSHAGRNVIQFRIPEADGELTDRNNSALVQINGIRDRLRVLLVSGEPHSGGRTWRNLLKSDSSVDLVHFTILRPPEKQDGVPVGELSLIAFPTRELFLEKIDDFDLIVFDRYKRRGILPSLYLDNVRQYVENGGAILVAAGPDFASADSIYRSPLSQVIPAEPTARVIEQGYRPAVTALGQRHPVTAGLTAPSEGPEWGRWLRQVEVEATRGNVVMSGFDDQPLLVLDRVGEGRVALLASDHAWLWSRGYENGGPQLELLRRLAHWMMKEPELEEEALIAETSGETIRIIRRTLKETTPPVTVTTPGGETRVLTLEETFPGRFEVTLTGEDIGLYRYTDGELSNVVGLGPSSPRELIETVATPGVLEPLIEANRGGFALLDEGFPSLRTVRPGRPAAGRNWLGITPRGAFETKGIMQYRLLPTWLVLLLVSGFMLSAWLREGRR
ncbi:glutamine amidotransferase [Marimonas lutisalis]|uniref:glutamine amidotransferase n=1 Tax=Marimonas lutisalis TaxID=2545756 RepID=UPI0010F4B41C|nr:glutamine amidotransferase [Marimonas lutisalis]